ncbi:MAG: response regulator [Bdellovibrionales bacterium]|nr:response regulator [Bdellovibrionales bacterium]
MRTVLIVDDIPYVRKTLKQILSARGFKVVGEAENGEIAVGLYGELLPDVVTMDLVMPVMNGVDATKRILAINPDARIVILSAMMQENLVADAIMAGAKDYIIKPFQTDEVMKVMNHVCPAQSSTGIAGGAA